MKRLEQLQRAGPLQYKQASGRIAANLRSAAHTAQANGETAGANQLDRIAKDFAVAALSGQPPDAHHLAQAIGGHHHYHSAHAFQDATTQNDTTDPLRIILNTLSSAGIK